MGEELNKELLTRTCEYQESATDEPEKPKRFEVTIRLNHVPTSINVYGKTAIIHGEGNTIEEVFNNMDDQMNKEHEELENKKDAYQSIKTIFKK